MEIRRISMGWSSAGLWGILDAMPPNHSTTGNHRQMRHVAYREDALRRRFDPHVEPLNRLVEELRRPDRGYLPWVDPLYAGVSAEVLLLLKDPGPMTDSSNRGSGFISTQNDDPTAERLARLLEESGLGVERVVAWNIWPWVPTGKSYTNPMLDEGGDALLRALGMMQRLRVVITMGLVAKRGWERLVRRDIAVAHDRIVLHTLHTSRRGITNGGQSKAAVGEDRVRDTMREAVRILHAPRH